MNVETLTNKMVLQKGIVDFLKLKLEESDAKYEKVHKLSIDVVNNMNALVNQVVICKRHDRVVGGVVGRFLKGGDTRRSLVPQPSLLVESLDLIPRTWITIDKCAFCGLEFSFVRVA
jgi:hypothetical protein